METKTAVGLLASIAHEVRLEVFRLLVQAGSEGLPAGAIAEQLNIPTSTLSFHLKELTHAGLVTPNPQGRFIFYAANYQVMTDLLTYLTLNCCAGQQDCCTPETVKKEKS